MHHHAPNCVVFIISKAAVKYFIKVFNRCQRFHHERSVGVRFNEVFFVVIKLVFDITNDLLEHILNRDDSAQPPIFIVDHRQVISVGAKLLEEHIQALAFRNTRRRTQQIAQIKFL